MIKSAKQALQLDRREALQTVGATVALAAASGASGLTGGAHAATPSLNASDRAGFWPNGARLAVSLSLMFEGGGQPISGAGGVIPDPIEGGVPDLPTMPTVITRASPECSISWTSTGSSSHRS